jgi:cytochrome c556
MKVILSVIWFCAASGMARDTRTPVPMAPMMAQHQREQMRGHLSAVQEIVAALAKSDFKGVEAGSKKIGYSDSMAQMCTHMGAGAPGFTEAAIHFHKTADTIGAAARKKDRAAVLGALGATLNTCVGCHATYKQQIVE